MKKGKDGRYRKCVTIAGKRYDIRGKTQAEVNRKYDELLEKKHDGSLFMDDNIYLGDYVKKFLEVKKPTVTNATFKMYCDCVERLKPLFDYPLCKITHTDLQTLLNGLSDVPNTQRKVRLTMNQIFEMAVTDRVILYNPAVKLVVTPYRKEQKRALTEKERQAVKNAKLSAHDRLFLDCLYYLGLRKSEALALKRSDFDIKEGVVTIKRSLDIKAQEIKSTKSISGERTIPVPLPLINELRTYPEFDYLFRNSNGDLHTEGSYKRLWNRIIKATGVNLSAHYYRHNYCTVLAENGVDIKIAQRYLGHADFQTTMNIYAHVTDEKESATRQLVKNLF